MEENKNIITPRKFNDILMDAKRQLMIKAQVYDEQKLVHEVAHIQIKLKMINVIMYEVEKIGTEKLPKFDFDNI